MKKAKGISINTVDRYQTCLVVRQSIPCKNMLVFFTKASHVQNIVVSVSNPLTFESGAGYIIVTLTLNQHPFSLFFSVVLK